MNSRIGDAVEEVKKSVVLSPSDPFMKGELGTLLGLVGRRDEASKILEELRALSKITYVPSVEIAQTLLSLGKTDEAFDYFRKIGEDRSSRFLYFRVWPWFTEFRKDPRWASIESSIGITTLGAPANQPPIATNESGFSFEFESDKSRTIFDKLASDFLVDYMVRNYMQEKSGWRSIVEIAHETNLPLSSLYSRTGGVALPFRELMKRGIIEMKLLPGQRGRGGEVTKMRIAYEKEPVKEHINNLARTHHKKE